MLIDFGRDLSVTREYSVTGMTSKFQLLSGGVGCMQHLLRRLDGHSQPPFSVCLSCGGGTTPIFMYPHLQSLDKKREKLQGQIQRSLVVRRLKNKASFWLGRNNHLFLGFTLPSVIKDVNNSTLPFRVSFIFLNFNFL